MKKRNDHIRFLPDPRASDLSVRFVEYLNIEPGESETIQFQRGNTYVKIKENVRNKDIYLCSDSGINANDSFMELLF
jgi:ribose-phosphate pyrophosphokinase